MNADDVTLTSITDRKGAPATRVSLRVDDRYALTVPAIHSFEQLSAASREWLELFMQVKHTGPSLVAYLQHQIKQSVHDHAWPQRVQVEGWYELILDAPLVVGMHGAVKSAWQYLADRGWTSDQAGRFHWPEAKGALTIPHMIELFRTDPILQPLPLQFAVRVHGGSVSETIAMCKDYPVAALIDPYAEREADASLLRRELAGHRLSVGVYDSTHFVSPAVLGPNGCITQAAEAYAHDAGVVVLDDPFMSWGPIASIARGLYASGVIAGPPLSTGSDVYTTNADL